MGKALLVFLVVVATTGPGAFGFQTRSPALSFVLMDGTVVTGEMEAEEIAVETRYGDLDIPVGELVLLIPGLSSHPELAERLELLLPSLGSPDTAVRERSVKKLIELGPWFQTIVAEYAEDQPPERKALFQQILASYKKASATATVKPLGWQDNVETRRFPVVGRITNRRFAVRTSYGRLNVKLSHIRRAAAAERVSIDPERKCDHAAVKLLDGVHVKGKIDVPYVAVTTPYGTLKVPTGHITTIGFNQEDGTALVQLCSGDEIVGVTDIETLNVKTAYDMLTIPASKVASIDVYTDRIDEGPVLYYSFDKDEGNKVTDQSGKGNDGNVVGAKWTKKGRIGGAYEFDNDIQLIRVPGPWNLAEKYTISACVKFSHFNGYYPIIIYGSDRQIVFHGRGRMGYGAGKEGGVTFYSVQEDDAEDHFRHSMTTSKFDVGKWYSITVVVNGRKASVYTNGRLDAQKEDSTAYGIADMQSISIGGCDEGPRSPSFRQFHGAIDEVRIWKRALLEREVKQLHNSWK